MELPSSESLDPKRIGKAKEQACSEGSDGRVIAKDHGCETDEAFTGGHPLIKPATDPSVKKVPAKPATTPPSSTAM